MPLKDLGLRAPFISACIGRIDRNRAREIGEGESVLAIVSRGVVYEPRLGEVGISR